MEYQYGIDLDSIANKESFVLGLVWMSRAIRSVNEGIQKDMHAFDGDEQAEGIRMVIGKQNAVLADVEKYVRSVLDET